MPPPPQSAGQPQRPPDELTAKVAPVMERADRFWTRVTDGMQVDQLWKQFRADARSSYRLYSTEVEEERTPGVSKGKHFFRLVGRFFWAVLEKLTPARRVLLLVALVLLLSPTFNVSVPNRGDEYVAQGGFASAPFWGGL